MQDQQDSDGLLFPSASNASCAKPRQVRFEDAADDFREPRFWIASGLPTNRSQYRRTLQEISNQRKEVALINAPWMTERRDRIAAREQRQPCEHSFRRPKAVEERPALPFFGSDSRQDDHLALHA